MDLSWILVHIGSGFIETYVVFSLLGARHSLKRSEQDRNISMAIIVLIMVLKNVPNVTDVQFLSENVFMLAIAISMFIASNIIFEGKKIEHFIIICLGIIGITIIDYITISILIKILNIELSQILLKTPTRFVAITISKVVDYMAIHMYIKISVKDKSLMSSKYTLEYIVIVISNIICIFLINAYFKSSVNQSNEYTMLQSTLVLAFGITSVGVIFIYERIIKQTRKDMEYRLAFQAREYQDSYKKNIEETAEILSRNKHDFHNHVVAIKGLLERDKALEASSYMDNLITNMQGKMKNVVITNNPVADAIITFKKDMAQKHSIYFTERVNIQNLNVDDVDMTVILGNILDNAIEASIKEKENRFIHIDISEEQGYIRIKCTNNFDGTIHVCEEGIKTLKTDKKNHGYGLKNIEAISKKYDGYIKTDIGENFCITVYIKNTKQKAHAN